MKRETNVKMVTIGIFIVTFLSAIEGTIVTTAMPTIVGSLHGIEIMNWVFTIYLLTSATVTPIYGKLADKIGRKPIMIFGISLFVLGSALSGLSNTMETLILARGLQGFGAGAIMPVSLTMIADMYDFKQRTKVLGLNSAAWGISSVVGPLAGGLIVDTIGWHWIFFINVPIGIVVIFMMQYYFVEKPRQQTKQKMDVLGSLFLMLTLVSLLLGFQFLGDDGLSLRVGLLFILTLTFGLIFRKVEKTADDPVINLVLFKNRNFLVVNAVAALMSGFIMSLDVYIPMWMQGVAGRSAAIGGLVLAPLSLVWMIGSFLSGRLLAKYPPRKVLTVGLTIILTGAIMMVMFPQNTPFFLFFVVSSIFGLGFGLSMTTTTVEAQSSVPAKDVGVATSFNTLSRTIGQTVMISIFGILMNWDIARRLPQIGEQLDPDIMNKLINPHTAMQIATDLREILRGILFESLHFIYIGGFVLIIVALALTLLMGKSLKSDKL